VVGGTSTVTSTNAALIVEAGWSVTPRQAFSIMTFMPGAAVRGW